MEDQISLVKDLIQTYPDPSLIPLVELQTFIMSFRAKRAIHWINNEMIKDLFGMVTTYAHTDDPIPSKFILEFKIGGISVTRKIWRLHRLRELRDISLFISIQNHFLHTLKYQNKHTNEHIDAKFLDVLDQDHTDYSKIALGLKCQMLKFIKGNSPSIYSICYNVRSRSRVDCALYQNKVVPFLLFGVNKAIAGYKQLGQTPDFFDELLKCFMENTDNKTVLKEAIFKIPNQPLPRAIIMMSKYALDKMNPLMVAGNTEVCLKQFMTTMQMNDAIRVPLSCLGENISLVSHKFKLNRNNGLQTKEVSSEQSLRYFNFKEEPKVATVPLTDEMFEGQHRDITSLDLMAPTGVRLLKPNDSKKRPKYPMQTHFTTSGRTETLSLTETKNFIRRIFTLNKELLFDKKRFPLGLCDTNGGDRNSPSGFSCDNTLIGKTFLFYHCGHAEENITSGLSKKKRKRSTSDPSDVDVGGAVCNTLYLNKYVLQNHYMSKDLIVSNIINLLKKWGVGIPQYWKEVVNVENFLDKNKHSQTTAKEGDDEDRQMSYERPIADGQNNSYIQDHVSNTAFRGMQEFAKELVKLVFRVLKEEESLDNDKVHVTNIALFVLALQNEHLADQEGELLDYINPGFGVIWIKTESIKTEPLIVCRPCAYSSLTGTFDTKIEERNHDYSMEFTFFSNSIKPGSIIVPNAYVRYWNPEAMGNVIDPSSEVQAGKAMEELKSASQKDRILSDEFDGWWPVICPPDLNATMFESANTPVGRLFTHYSSKEDFLSNFNNPSVKDIKFNDVFTMNEVFSDVASNINTLLLYSKNVLNNGFCPLAKYLTFDYDAAMRVDLMMSDAARTVEQIQHDTLKTNNESSRNQFLHQWENDVSRLIGSAFPITCGIGEDTISITGIDPWNT